MDVAEQSADAGMIEFHIPDLTNRIQTEVEFLAVMERKYVVQYGVVIRKPYGGSC